MKICDYLPAIVVAWKSPGPWSKSRENSKTGRPVDLRALRRLGFGMFKLGGGAGGLPPNITRNDWRAQAKASVEDIRDEKYRSAALKIQVKLAEALSRASPNEARALERNPRPDKTRTAVCLELMGDLCDLAGPLGETLRTIREELAKGIYSDYYLSDANALAFDQLPFFVVVERLAGEKVKLAEELERLRAEIETRDRAVRTLEASVATMKTSAAREATARQDLERRLLDAEGHATIAETDLCEANAELRKLREELLATKEELLLHRAENVRLKGPTGALTPRPDWNELDPHDRETYEEDRTADLARGLCDELATLKTKAAELSKFAEATSLIEPEAEARDFFANRGDSAEDEEAKDEGPTPEDGGAPSLATLGAGAEVPRFLRAQTDRVPARKLSKRETESFIEEVWAGKDRDDASRANPRALHEYLHQHLREKFAGDHTAVVEFGYNLCAALRKYDYDADVEMFRAVLFGQLSEHVRGDRANMTASLLDLLSAAAGHPSLIGRDELAAALGEFFPAKSESDLAALVKGVAKDQPDGEFVDFARLFAEDNNKDQGAFATAMYAQHWREIQAYAEGVTAAARSAGGGKGGPTPLSAVREKLRAKDPSKAEGDVDALVMRGAGLASTSEVAMRCDLGETVDVEAFVARVHTGLVKHDNFNLAAVRKYRPEGSASAAMPPKA